jgi:hypothetical protein
MYTYKRTTPSSSVSNAAVTPIWGPSPPNADYRTEAKNQETVRQNLLSAGFGRDVLVPRAYTDLCTREVLVRAETPMTGCRIQAARSQEFTDKIGPAPLTAVRPLCGWRAFR